MMAKDPAFLFYPGDFTTGTQFFTDEQVGKYIRLLLAQHQHGHLPEKHMIFICKSYDKDIFSKFIQDPDGLWYNERLEIEMIKRKNYVESRSKNKEGKTKEKIISNSYDSHMENENRNVIGINTIVDRKGIEDAIFTDRIFMAEVERTHPGKDVKQAWNECYLHFSSQKTQLQEWQWRQKLNTWLSKSAGKKNGHHINPGKVQ
jgi:hypothetical protein